MSTCYSVGIHIALSQDNKDDMLLLNHQEKRPSVAGICALCIIGGLSGSYVFQI